MIRRLTALCGALALLVTLGCGNKGPLYLPQPDAAQQPDAGEEQPE
jgi:predicted small lipoprotein YifL